MNAHSNLQQIITLRKAIFETSNQDEMDSFERNNSFLEKLTFVLFLRR